MGSKTELSYGGLYTTREPVGTRSPYSWGASPGPSKSLWLRSASVCSMGSPPWMISPSTTVQCPLQWRSAPHTIISTVCILRRVRSTCSSVTLWMTVGMDPTRRAAVSVSLGYKYAVLKEILRSFTEQELHRCYTSKSFTVQSTTE